MNESIGGQHAPLDNLVNSLGSVALSPEGATVLRERPRILTQEELLAGAISQFRAQLDSGDLTLPQITEFVHERATGVKLNGVDVVSLDLRAIEPTLDPVMQAYIASPRTKSVVVEYFEPELRKNGVYKWMQRKASLTKFYRRRGKDSVKSDGDVVPLMDGNLEEQENEGRHDDFYARLATAHSIANACKDAGKSVTVADIANKPSYQPVRGGFRGSVSFLGAVSGALAYLKPEWGQVFTSLYLASETLGLGWVFGVILPQAAKERGMFGRDKVAKLEHLMLDYEQARRLYLAKGVEQLTEQLASSENDSTSPQVVVLYPKAHGIRVVDILNKPRPVLNKAKSAVYKGFAPWLTFARRTWECQGEQSASNGQNTYDGWAQTGNERITM